MSSAAAWVEAAGGVLTAAAGLMTHAVRTPSSTLLAPSFHRGNAGRASIALTFDDGPSESTPELLAVLAEHRVPATFFQCGANIRRLPDIARRVRDAGHEIGNHTDSHPKLYFKSAHYIAHELASAQETIQRVMAVQPRFFRPPYGVRWFGLARAQARLSLMGVMWTTIGVDWKWPTDRVVSRLLRGATNGAIFCLHDGRTVEEHPDIRVTIGAVRAVIPALLDRGFHFERVSEIICPTKN